MLTSVRCILWWCYSKWLEVVPLATAMSYTTIEKCVIYLQLCSLLQIFMTDGSQFTSNEFQAFMKSNGIKHIYSSPYHPSTNDLAEQAVQSFKERMKCIRNGSIGEQLVQFLLCYRLTPFQNAWEELRGPLNYWSASS